MIADDYTSSRARRARRARRSRKARKARRTRQHGDSITQPPNNPPAVAPETDTEDANEEQPRLQDK